MNNAALLRSRTCARILSRREPPLADSMPRSWVYMMAVLIACLITSIVIAAIRLL
ncbi:MAG: hypothetical protein ACRDLO_10460 [Solirubrobacterales bacterium]